MTEKKNLTVDERLEADSEFKAAYEYFNADRMAERLKEGHRRELERERREAERWAHEDRRRQRLQRLTFGLFPRGERRA